MLVIAATESATFTSADPDAATADPAMRKFVALENLVAAFVLVPARDVAVLCNPLVYPDHLEVEGKGD
jgi:hypothetical protein